MADAGGAGGAAAPALAPAPKTLAELRAEASAAGAPADLPDSALSNWLLCSGGAPMLQLKPKGIFLLEGDTQANKQLHHLQ